jgi:radical SAM superfamily enzyme YgiQ (UPF0313 family)
LTKIAFIQNLWTENLGVMYLTGMLKSRGYDARIFIDVRGNNALREVLEYHPQVVGVSCTTGLHHWGIAFLQAVKTARPGIVTLIGGPHASFCPEVALVSGVDYAVRGESEDAIIKIAEAMKDGSDISALDNIAYQRDGELVVNPLGHLIDDLDTIPFPDRSYYDRYPLTKREGSKNFIAGRGCPYACAFCGNYQYHQLYRGKGKWVRYRSPDNILSEIEMVRDKYGIKFVGFSDDTLVFNKKWLAGFMEQYRRRIGLPFISTVRANLVDEELVRILKEGGCQSCVFGVESGDERIRNEVLLKGVTDAEIRFTAELFRKHQIRFGTYNMLGLPGETIDDAFKTVKLNAQIRPDFPWCSVLQPYPGTKIHRDLEQVLGRKILSDEIGASYFTASVLKHPQIRQMENLQKWFHLAVRFPFLQPLIKVLIKLPPNPFFTLVFQASYGWQLLRRSRLNLWQMFKYWWTQQGLFSPKLKVESPKSNKIQSP